MERRLIVEYETLIEALIAALALGNHALAVALARIPDAIRGYGPVKAESVRKAKATEAELLARFRSPAPEASAA